MGRRSIKGQEEIQKALDDKDPFALWKLVMFVGYKKIPSINERKLIFLRTYKDFDESVNDNFIAYYSKCIHYTMLNNFKKVANPLSQDANAKNRLEKRNNWPTYENMFMAPQSQNENILSTFVF